MQEKNLECVLFIDDKRVNPVVVFDRHEVGDLVCGVIGPNGLFPRPDFPARIPDNSDPAILEFPGGERIPVRLTEAGPGGRKFISKKGDWPPLDKIAPPPFRPV
jgi:hypothetical protein